MLRRVRPLDKSASRSPRREGFPDTAVLEVEGLRTEFNTAAGRVHAVNGVSFSVAPGETLGVVGESGCGKSVTALSMMRLVSPPGLITDGRVLLGGTDLMTLSDEGIRRVRGLEVAMIFQDPMTSLNPVLTIGHQIIGPLRVHLGMTRSQARQRAIALLDTCGIPDPQRRLSDYPHKLSGGMRQRVMIAMALSCEPKVLIADEPTTALDVTIQAQILDLLNEMRDRMGMAIVLITHDLGVVAEIADRVCVMYAGRIVETASADEVIGNPRHPYTIGLLRSTPRLDQKKVGRLEPIQGSPPDMLEPSSGCPFRPRCFAATTRCDLENPLLESVGPSQDDHQIACFVDVAGDGLGGRLPLRKERQL